MRSRPWGRRGTQPLRSHPNSQVFWRGYFCAHSQVASKRLAARWMFSSDVQHPLGGEKAGDDLLGRCATMVGSGAGFLLGNRSGGTVTARIPTKRTSRSAKHCSCILTSSEAGRRRLFRVIVGAATDFSQTPPPAPYFTIYVLYASQVRAIEPMFA